MELLKEAVSAEVLRQKPREEQKQILSDYVRREINGLLECNEEASGMDSLILDLNSLTLMRLINTVSDGLEISFEPEELIPVFSHLSFSSLIESLLDKINTSA